MNYIKFENKDETIEISIELLKEIDKAHLESENRLKAIEKEEQDDWQYAD